mmetsp:Transcript_19152/g.44023  ORF Transcript_19152/g.44023 Transcript_19152/m.44023 type:complete len:365 (-) Transcript_19152:315-1409(-)
MRCSTSVCSTSRGTRRHSNGRRQAPPLSPRPGRGRDVSGRARCGGRRCREVASPSAELHGLRGTRGSGPLARGAEGLDPSLHLVIHHEHVDGEVLPRVRVRFVREQVAADVLAVDHLARRQPHGLLHDVHGDLAEELLGNLAQLRLLLFALLLELHALRAELVEDLERVLRHRHLVREHAERLAHVRRVKGAVVLDDGLAELLEGRKVDDDRADGEQQLCRVEKVLLRVLHLEVLALRSDEPHQEVVEHRSDAAGQLGQHEDRRHLGLGREVLHHVLHLVGELHEVARVRLLLLERVHPLVHLLPRLRVPARLVRHLHLRLVDRGELSERLVHRVDGVVDQHVDEADEVRRVAREGHHGRVVLG